MHIPTLIHAPIVLVMSKNWTVLIKLNSINRQQMHLVIIVKYLSDETQACKTLTRWMVAGPFNFHLMKIFIYLFRGAYARYTGSQRLNFSAALKITVVVDPSFRYFHDDDDGNNARN